MENSTSSIKFLHTSDWHLGRSLYGLKRYKEQGAFLEWLVDLISEKGIDVVLVSGDIFDTTTPSNRAQELYYRFLSRAAASSCRHIILISGNHDSPTFLDAPAKLLKTLNVTVVGSLPRSIEQEVVVLRNKVGDPEALVCAVPYLRDRDIRTAEPGETGEDKNRKLIQGIQRHYAQVCSIAKMKRATLGDIPIIAMGHLFTKGGKTLDGDGVRELYAGSLVHVETDVFPACIDYLALGHLHVAQKVKGSECLRYSGSPMPVGFAEAGQKKQVVMVTFNRRLPEIQEIEVPCFQTLERVSGGLDEIKEQIEKFRLNQSDAWLEVDYTGRTKIGNLSEHIYEMVSGSSMEICRIKNKSVVEQVRLHSIKNETLDDLDVNDIFQRCLDAHHIDPDDRESLIISYKEMVTSLYEADKQED